MVRSANDEEFLPTVYADTQRIFTFENEINETVEISVANYNRNISYEGSGFGNTSSHPGNYETLTIELKVSSEPDPNCQTKKITAYKNFDESVSIYFENSILPYPCNGGYIIESIKTPFEYSSMQINGINYEKVVVFNYSGSNNTPFFHKKYSFDKVYYDLKNGFIGFDDTAENVHFKLI